MVEGSNDAFPPKEVPFGVSLKKIEFTGSITPKNRRSLTEEHVKMFFLKYNKLA
jgi:hypothetical protein